LVVWLGGQIWEMLIDEEWVVVVVVSARMAMVMIRVDSIRGMGWSMHC
jgi:hypothetical protein